MAAMEHDSAAGADVTSEGASGGEAKWSAIRALEPEFPGVVSEHVDFEVLDEGDEGAGRPARVRARVDVARWEAAESEALPEEPVERVRALVGRVTRGLGLRASVD